MNVLYRSECCIVDVTLRHPIHAMQLSTDMREKNVKNFHQVILVVITCFSKLVSSILWTPAYIPSRRSD